METNEKEIVKALEILDRSGLESFFFQYNGIEKLEALAEAALAEKSELAAFLYEKLLCLGEKTRNEMNFDQRLKHAGCLKECGSAELAKSFAEKVIQMLVFESKYLKALNTAKIWAPEKIEEICKIAKFKLGSFRKYRQLSEISEFMGKPEEAKAYRTLADVIEEPINSVNRVLIASYRNIRGFEYGSHKEGPIELVISKDYNQFRLDNFDEGFFYNIDKTDSGLYTAKGFKDVEAVLEHIERFRRFGTKKATLLFCTCPKRNEISKRAEEKGIKVRRTDCEGDGLEALAKELTSK